MTIDAAAISEAIVVWVDQGGPSPVPRPDDARVIALFGEDAALDLLPVIKQLYGEFFASDAVDRIEDYSDMLDSAKQDFRRSHPEISAEAADALKWCLSWDYR